jgi:hypothetical protein
MPLVITPATDPLAPPNLAEEGSDLGHVELALSRLIERWKADANPNLAAIVSSCAEEVQELENAIWFVIFGRMPDYAEGAQLDMLGRIVGQGRNGLSDDQYRAHIKARIRINQSYGRAFDVIEVLRLIDTVPFRLVEFGTASFRVTYDAPPTDAGLGHEIPELIRQSRAAGVSAYVSFPVDRLTGRGAFFGSAYGPTLNSARGFSSSYDPTVGGLYSHTARA